MTKVLLGAILAIMVGAGPAVAWDVTTQMPHPRPAAGMVARGSSPWRRAGRDLKDAFKALARAYLPRTNPTRPMEQARLTPAPTASSIASAAPTVRPMPALTIDLE